MPYITIESGVLSDEQKENLIHRLTEVSSEIMNVPQEFFSITIKELPDKNFGIGGKTIDKVKSEYVKKHKLSPIYRTEKTVFAEGMFLWKKLKNTRIVFGEFL